MRPLLLAEGRGLITTLRNRSGLRPFTLWKGLEGRVIVEQYKGRGRKAGVPAAPRQPYAFFYRLFMRCVFGSRRMRL